MKIKNKAEIKIRYVQIFTISQIITRQIFIKYFDVFLSFTKEKEVFMQSTDQSWKPSVNIA